MINADFLGMNNFVWWFGVVENRLDPLQMGRCQVRCFGWHTDDTNQIPISELPWAHPVVPYGVNAVQAPAEGTMVFGFFADGKEALYPIILGSVPGIPQEVREFNRGFADPYTDEQKATQQWPRKIKNAVTATNNQGVQVTDDTPKRFPNRVGLNEPTVSRLARPERREGESGSFIGIPSYSIANTTIDIQRKNRVANVVSASREIFHEPFPSFAAKYPFNNVTETESGHAFEMDDTQGYERVQLSHRVGSTLEFMSEGDVKLKSMRSRYDFSMGNAYEYVNGKKDMVIQSDMFLKVHGKLVIQCADLEITSPGTVNIKGSDVNITALNSLNLASKGEAKLSSLNTNVSGELSLSMFGGPGGAVMSSSGPTKTSGLFNNVEGIIVSLNGVLLDTRFTLHNFLSPIPDMAPKGKSSDRASTVKTPMPKDLKRTSPYAKKPKTNKFAFMEQLKTDLKKTATSNNTAVAGANIAVPTGTSSITANIDPKTGVATVVVSNQTVTVDPNNPTTPSISPAAQTTAVITPPAGSSGAAAANTSPEPSTNTNVTVTTTP